MWINLAELAGKKRKQSAGFASDEQYFSRAFRKIVGITPKGPVFRRTQLDENGNIVALAEDEILEPADFTVIAASQGPKSKLINTTEGLEGTEKGLLKVDAEGRTTVPGVFAAGGRCPRRPHRCRGRGRCEDHRAGHGGIYDAEGERAITAGCPCV